MPNLNEHPSKVRVVAYAAGVFALSFLVFAGAMHLCEVWSVGTFWQQWIAGIAWIAALLIMGKGAQSLLQKSGR